MESRPPKSVSRQGIPSTLGNERSRRFLKYFFFALLLSLGSLILVDLLLYRTNLHSQIGTTVAAYFQSPRFLRLIVTALPLALILGWLAFIAAKSRTLALWGRRQILESEIKLRTVLDNTLALAYLKDAQGRYLFVNKPMADLMGLDPEEVVGRRDEDLLDTSPCSSWEHDLQVLQSGKPIYSEDHLVSNGVERTYHTVHFALRSPEGLIYGVCGIATDITDLQQAREVMRQAMTVFNHTKEGILIADAEGIITLVNPAFLEMSGYSEEQLVGQDIRLHSLSLQDDALFQQLMEGLEQTGAWRGELQNRRHNGSLYPAWETVTTVKENGQIKQYIYLVSDISALKETEQRLQYLAHYDSLTGLANRDLFNERLHQAVADAERRGCLLAILFINIDQFKLINDSLGHSVGDEVLYEVAKRLKQLLRSDDMVARLGGDEFAIILHQLEQVEDIDNVVRKIIRSTSSPLILSNTSLSIGVSIGISVYPNDSTQVDGLLAAADIAVYRAKKKGRRTYAYYTKELARIFHRRHKAEQDLRRALDEGQLQLYYQPQVAIKTGQPLGVEALLRWNHPTKGIISPAPLIQVAEETGLIQELGDWVIEEASAQVRRWRHQGAPIGHVAINVSGQQILHGQLLATIKRCLAPSAGGSSGISLEIEITESILQHPEEATRVIEELRELGLNVVIDDFGTGYSSLSQLKELDIDKLKIAGVFMEQIPQQKNACAIASAIVSLGHSLGLPIVAEGVENDEQVIFLKSIGCDIIQGYYYAKPMPAEKLLEHPLYQEKAVVY